ncbi:MAG: hypothetical protein WAM11_01520 [Cyanobium sp.]
MSRNDSASDLIYPLLPLYLTSVLMAGPRALGLIEGAGATASLFRLLSGVLSDRSGTTRPWGFWHAHEHLHEPIDHEHPHVSDAHHRHSH